MSDDLKALAEQVLAADGKATKGPWVYRPDEDNGQGEREGRIDSTAGEWKFCGYYCRWTEPSSTDRGKQATPHGHEHFTAPPVVSAEAYHGLGTIDISDEDAALIALYRTAAPDLARAYLALREAATELLMYSPYGLKEGDNAERAVLRARDKLRAALAAHRAGPGAAQGQGREG